MKYKVSLSLRVQNMVGFLNMGQRRRESPIHWPLSKDIVTRTWHSFTQPHSTISRTSMSGKWASPLHKMQCFSFGSAAGWETSVSLDMQATSTVYTVCWQPFFRLLWHHQPLTQTSRCTQFTNFKGNQAAGPPLFYWVCYCLIRQWAYWSVSGCTSWETLIKSFDWRQE